MCRDDLIPKLIEPSRAVMRGLDRSAAYLGAAGLRMKRDREDAEARKANKAARMAAAASRRQAKRAGLAERILALSPGAHVERLATGVHGEILATPTAGPVRPRDGMVLVRFPRRIEELPAHLLRPAQGRMEG